MSVGDFVLFFSINLVVVTWLTYHFYCITKESSITIIPLIYNLALIFSAFEFLFVFANVFIVVVFWVLLVVFGLDAFANQLIRKRKTEKDYFTPQHEFLHAWLKHYGEHNSFQADACIDILKAKERADFAAQYPELSHPELINPRESSDTLCLTGDHTVANNVESNNNVIALDAYRKK